MFLFGVLYNISYFLFQYYDLRACTQLVIYIVLAQDEHFRKDIVTRKNEKLPFLVFIFLYLFCLFIR